MVSNVSRRSLIKEIAVFSAAAVILPILASTAAEAKASKAAVHYRGSPKGMQMCHMCRYNIAGGGRRGGMGGLYMDGGSMMGMMGAGACQVVEGRISPMGWCDLYAPA